MLIVCFLLTASAFGDCMPIEQAPEHIGATACVTGTVLKVAEGRTGNYYLDFCKNYRECPFTVFVPARNLRDVGDIRQLEGKAVEIHGKIQQYGGRAEIVLTDARQLKGDTAKLPPLPKEFDAERKGKFSAGKFGSPKGNNIPHGQPPPMSTEQPPQ